MILKPEQRVIDENCVGIAKAWVQVGADLFDVITVNGRETRDVMTSEMPIYITYYLWDEDHYMNGDCVNQRAYCGVDMEFFLEEQEGGDSYGLINWINEGIFLYMNQVLFGSIMYQEDLGMYLRPFFMLDDQPLRDWMHMLIQLESQKMINTFHGIENTDENLIAHPGLDAIWIENNKYVNWKHRMRFEFIYADVARIQESMDQKKYKMM